MKVVFYRRTGKQPDVDTARSHKSEHHLTKTKAVVAGMEFSYGDGDHRTQITNCPDLYQAMYEHPWKQSSKDESQNPFRSYKSKAKQLQDCGNPAFEFALSGHFG
jgi:hypothetical protein